MLRRYQKEDVKRIVELELSTLQTSLGEDMLISELSNPFSYYYVYEEFGLVIGYISISYDGEIAEVLNFCVDKKYQNKGIGSKMLMEAINLIDPNSVVLEVRDKNEQAIHVYEKLGFKQIHVRKRYYSNGDNALVLQWERR